MLSGLNHNFRHAQTVYHVQTEVSGFQPVRIDTHVFHDGRVLASKQTSCEGMPIINERQASWTKELQTLMQQQHKAMLLAIRSGQIEAA